MERALEKHGHYENFEEKTGGKILNRPEIVSIIKHYLRQEDLEDEIRLNLSEDLLSRASMTKGKGKATLNVRIVNLREFWVEGLLRHEIGIYVLLCSTCLKNNDYSPYLEKFAECNCVSL